MNNKTTTALKIFAISTITLLAIIIFNLKRHKEDRARNYQRNKVFSVVVSEETWDESMMPRGRRSPKGVLYNPEK
jgi:hypothetical protein